jgi:5'-nucleotidase
VERDWIDTLTIDIANFNFSDPIEEAKSLTKFLKEQKKVDIVIALTHMRLPSDEELADKVPGLDFILVNCLIQLKKN